MNMKIIVAAHKPYAMPHGDVYLPLQVGAALHPPIGFVRDDAGDNISAKNPNYCELTGLYWAWKNLESDYLGLMHYRRHFKGAKGTLMQPELEELLKKIDVVLPKKRNYWIETNYSQYVHAHHAIDLDATRAILVEKHPSYVAAWDASMKRTWGHRFNMFVMKRTLANEYCAWLFDILFELEKRLDISRYSNYDARVFGFVSERLLDPWLETRSIPYAEVSVRNLESQHWLRKILNFLLRKLGLGGRQ